MQEQTLKATLTGIFTLAATIGTSLILGQSQDYIVPRTADGQPDLQGLWTNDTITQWSALPLSRVEPFSQKMRSRRWNKTLRRDVRLQTII